MLEAMGPTDEVNGTAPPRPDLDHPEGSAPPPATWRAIESLPVGLLALGATAIVATVLAQVFPVDASAGTAGLTDSPGFFTFANMAQEIFLLASVVVWVRFINHGRLASLGLPPARPWIDAAVGLAGGASMVVGAGLVLAVVRAIAEAVAGHHISNPDQVPQNVNGALLAVSGLVVVVLAPLAEETFFRGFLYKGLRRRFSAWPAALISAFLFGIVHYSGVRFLLIIPSLILVGVVLAMVYERRQSLLASVATHATFNLIGFIFIVLSRS
jgi:membrane protease YdiL (CAAX protease family)